MIFNKFSDTDIVLGRTTRVSSGFWSDGNYAHSQSLLYTSSTQTQLTGSNGPTDVKNGLYYFNVYNANPNAPISDPNAQVHFSIADGNYYGSGSGDGNTSSLANPTKAIYSQYKNYLLNPDDTLFNFKIGSYNIVNGVVTDSTSTVTGSSIYVIAFSADKYKDRIDEGQLEFSLSGSKVGTFIDDSSIVKTQKDIYNIISGSIIDGVATPYYNGTSIDYKAIGLLYPKTGIIVLNAESLNTTIGVPYNNTVTGAYKVNQKYLYAALTASNTTMKVRKSEFLPSRQYFVRVKNQDFNYSNNPSYISDGTGGNPKGTILINEFLTDPKTYPTTIGLYDDSNELIAVAKLSQPVQKSFNNELLVRVRLDF